MTPEDQVWRHIQRNLGVPQQVPLEDAQGGMWLVAFALCAISGAVVGGIVGFVVGQLVGS
jgi:hypothetical protein